MGKASERQNARVYVRHSNDSHPQNRLEPFLTRHPFTAKVQILLPIRNPPGDIHTDLFDHNPFFNICKVELKTIVSEGFLKKWIRDSTVEFIAISVGGRADLTDTVCLIRGVLRLALTTESYRSLGLTGRRSRQRKDRYIVDVKLDGHHFRPGHRYYERVVSCFLRCKKVITMWVSASKDGRSITVPELDAAVEHLHPSSSVLRPCSVPDLPIRTTDDRFWSDPSKMHALFDWMGAASLGIDGGRVEGLQLHPCRILHRYDWTGLIAPCNVLRVVRRCRHLLEEYGLPWVTVILTGFQDTPLSFWTMTEDNTSPFDRLNATDHDVLSDIGGENDIMILLLPHRRSSVFVALGSGDNFRTM